LTLYNIATNVSEEFVASIFMVYVVAMFVNTYETALYYNPEGQNLNSHFPETDKSLRTSAVNFSPMNKEYCRIP
jgi:hypothetical protein